MPSQKGITAVASTTKTLIVKEKTKSVEDRFHVACVAICSCCFPTVSKTCRHATRLPHGTCFAARIPYGNKYRCIEIVTASLVLLQTPILRLTHDPFNFAGRCCSHIGKHRFTKRRGLRGSVMCGNHDWRRCRVLGLSISLICGMPTERAGRQSWLLQSEPVLCRQRCRTQALIETPRSPAAVGRSQIQPGAIPQTVMQWERRSMSLKTSSAWEQSIGNLP
jgi:hypothetical protein